MARKPRLIPAGTPSRLISLLLGWIEWRSIRGSPKSLKLPEARFVHRRIGNALVAGSWSGPFGRWAPGKPAPEPRIPATSPRRVGPLEEFGCAFNRLPEAAQAVLVAMADNVGRPWPPAPDDPEGEGWKLALEMLGVNSKQYEKALRTSFERLRNESEWRGLI